MDMSQSKFEIKITHEANGDNVDLADMSLQASKSLAVFLNALNKMAEAEKGASEIRVHVKEGSAIVALDAPSEIMKSIQENVFAVLERRSSSDAYLNGIDDIRKVIKANGLSYESNIYHGDRKIDLVGVLKGGLKRTRRRRDQNYFDIEFIEGRLIENGGVKPNIHVENGGIRYKITCTEKQAQRVNAFLYNTIRISAWVSLDVKANKEYLLCDSYTEIDIFNELKDEVRLIIDGKGTDPLIRIHNKFKEFIAKEKYSEARKFIRLFVSKLVDNHKLRAVLLVTKAFRNNSQFLDLVNEAKDILIKKTGRSIV